MKILPLAALVFATLFNGAAKADELLEEPMELNVEGTEAVKERFKKSRRYYAPFAYALGSDLIWTPAPALALDDPELCEKLGLATGKISGTCKASEGTEGIPMPAPGCLLGGDLDLTGTRPVCVKR